MVAVERDAPQQPTVTRSQWWHTALADVTRYSQAVRDSDQEVVDDTVMRLSRARPWLAPLALAVGAFAMLFDGVKLLCTNWRFTLIQVLPATWIWAAMLDLKVHFLHDKAVRDFRPPQLALLVLACAAITAASFYLNAVFAFAIIQPGRPQVRPAFSQAQSHVAVVLGWGTAVGLLLGISAFVVFGWGGLFWFTVSMSIVIGVMMICYVAVPSRLVGIKSTRSRRDKLTATVVGGTVGGLACTPPYLLGRLGILMLGSKVLFIPGVILLIIGGTLEAGTVGAVRTVKMSAKLVSAGNWADNMAPSGDNPHPDETGLPLLGRRRGGHRQLWSHCPLRISTDGLECQTQEAPMSTFPPIAEYGLLSNCEQSCLVAPNGAVEWLCLPRPDSPSVFAALLDRSAGTFRFGPSSAQVPQQRRYIAGTMVLETTWQTSTGWMTVQDFLAVGPAEGATRRPDYRRAPTDTGAVGALVRIATCISGRAEVAVNCAPLFNYGATSGTWSYQGDGYDAMTIAAKDADVELRLAGSIPLGVLGARGYGRTTLTAGESAYVVLSWGDAKVPASQDEAFRALSTTIDFWRDWLSTAKITDHPWKPYIDRSALTLKALSYAPTGAIMAAATTSLPETPGGERNWDYRYTWIRDSSFMLRALYRLGFDWEAIEYFGFIIDAVTGGDINRKPELQIMYGIGGERDLTERTLDHLSGYQGARPVRVGNGAWNQQQHDVWGMILDALDVQFRRAASQIVAPMWEGLAGFVDAALEHWREPDQGIWEVRGEPKHFTASKVLCWVAAARGADLAGERGDEKRAQRWRAGADKIKAEVLDKGISSRGVFRQHYKTDNLDASLLLLAILGFLPPDDDRIRATVLAIADELTQDGLVLRYKVEGTDTGFSGEEGTFTICSFWLVTALAMIGETKRAHALCEKLLSFAGPLLLYAEEIDATTGQHLGNFPQAFTHLALIEAVSMLIETEQAEDVTR